MAQSSHPPRGRSVFWKVAGILVGVQVVTGLLAVALSAWFAYGRSRELAAGSLRLRLDVMAEEVEQRMDLVAGGLDTLPLPLRLDLATYFPDPLILLDAEGVPIDTLTPSVEVFGVGVRAAVPPVPSGLDTLVADGDIVIRLDADETGGTWGLAPVFDRDGLTAGGLLVQPLDASLARELAGTRDAFTRALVAVAVLAGLSALALGAFFTERLVRPLRRMTQQVERLGAGDYAARLEAASDDEFGRLASAINQMAAAVEESIERLRATDRLRRELIANVGHDLRTPLTALRGYTEEAERYLAAGDRDAARDALATAARQGTYLTRLVDDLFELSVLDSAPPPLRREPIPLAELLHDAVHAHRSAFREAGLTFEVDIPPDLPLLEGDGVRLLRVLDNLLVNARQHTPAGGTVCLRAFHDAEDVCVAVADTGTGLTETQLKHIFDRYYRGEEARTRRGGGTGLGLAISRAIARAHGGDLSAESTPGQGSTFTLRLPLAVQ